MFPRTEGSERTLSDSEIETFEEEGFLLLEDVFTDEELGVLSDGVDDVMDDWAYQSEGFGGEWREDYLEADERDETELIAVHDLQFYCPAFAHLVLDPRLVSPVVQLVGPDVELHHTSLHAKPPQKGTPFPMHQDSVFWGIYGHDFVNCQIAIDDAPPERGPVCYLSGSHADGQVDHEEPEEGGFYLPEDDYPLEDAVEVPMEAGDVVLYNVHAIHGSQLNRSDEFRRLVRVGYKDPANEQDRDESTFGAETGFLVSGRRPPDRD
jgi:ectoine hydroxylase-related dioxygenase (phytanoyl-CoA dioxygenase family)